jgi:polyhydroxybutyrate depolymerase
MRIVALCAGVTSLAQPLVAQIQSRLFTHNGYSRPYLVYRPARLPNHPAVVFMLGGIRSTAEFAARNFGWIDEADRGGFLVVFPSPVATVPSQPPDRKTNITFWEMQGSRTHVLAPGAQPVDDDGYLMAVLRDVLRRDHPGRRRVFFAGFSSGSGMVQLFAARHPTYVRAIAAVATPFMEPPPRLSRPVSVLYIHGDDDEQFSGFETHSPNFATTPHGNWVTWGYLDGCQVQTAAKTDWGVRFSWLGCKERTLVVADFVAGLGHEWAGSLDSRWNRKHGPQDPLNFTHMAWQFFADLRQGPSAP